MPKSYIDALGELQQRNVDALTIAANAQLAALKNVREFAQSLAQSSSPLFGTAGAFRTLTDLTTSFTFALLDQQVAYTKALAEQFAAPAAASNPPPAAATETTGRLAAVTEPAAAFVSAAPPAEAAADAAPLTIEAPLADGHRSDVAPSDVAPLADAPPPDVAPLILDAADGDIEVLSKTLPAPPLVRGAETGQPRKIPAVSNNRMPPKRKPAKG